jgi:hypothetical protein
MLDNTTFNRVGTLTLPGSTSAQTWTDFVYLGGDAVALVGNQSALQIVRAPLIGSQP